jgi:DNA repair exonuclease SbcCD ATPase subunit
MTEVINGTCAGDLDDRIAAAFADSVKSSDVSALIAEAEGAAIASGEVAERARERALDPKLAANAVAEARREMDDAAFKRERLKTALSRLQVRLKEAKAREENERRWLVYKRIETERDRLVAELKAKYPAIEAQLGPLIADLEKNEREVDFINRHELPTGAERLESAELLARGIGSWRVGMADVVRIIEQLCLPSFKHDPHRPYVWPRSR